MSDKFKENSDICNRKKLVMNALSNYEDLLKCKEETEKITLGSFFNATLPMWYSLEAIYEKIPVNRIKSIDISKLEQNIEFLSEQVHKENANV